MLKNSTKKNDAIPDGSKSGSWLLRLVKEPIVYFVVIGLAIYVVSTLVGSDDEKPANQENPTVTMTEGEIRWLAETWQSRWQRPPTDEELQGLIRQRLRETILYREAKAMGLDKDDLVIRRMLAQKLEYLALELAQPVPPADAALQTYFAKNLDRYRLPPLITFTHAFLDPDKRGNQTLADAKNLMAQLTATGKAPDANGSVGDQFMLQSYYPEKSEADVAKLFGREFAKSIMSLKSGKWHGPVLSGYGTHLVYVHALQKTPPPTFEQVVDQVRLDWMNEKRQELSNEYIDKLLNSYEVVIEGEYSSMSPSLTEPSK